VVHAARLGAHVDPAARRGRARPALPQPPWEGGCGRGGVAAAIAAHLTHEAVHGQLAASPVRARSPRRPDLRRSSKHARARGGSSSSTHARTCTNPKAMTVGTDRRPGEVRFFLTGAGVAAAKGTASAGDYCSGPSSGSVGSIAGARSAARSVGVSRTHRLGCAWTWAWTWVGSALVQIQT
jgi:hypothetical protein